MPNDGEPTRRETWEKRYGGADAAPAQPARVLREFSHLLPEAGVALDLACGRGGNAVYLARRGLDVQAWDYSENAIRGLRTAASEPGLVLEAAVRDVVREPPAVCSFDVIVVSRFLERSLAPAIVKALRPDGLLFYQTFIRDAVGQGGPRKPDFRLGTNELLQLFASLTVLVYREEGTRGDTTEGFRDEAMLVAARPFDL
ncbi:MAG: methyltransferase domain-containing protein [Ectothiorhodospiraceae bacterium]|jgi:SAM-dependent methyltransferase